MARKALCAQICSAVGVIQLVATALFRDITWLGRTLVGSLAAAFDKGTAQPVLKSRTKATGVVRLEYPPAAVSFRYCRTVIIPAMFGPTSSCAGKPGYTIGLPFHETPG